MTRLEVALLIGTIILLILNFIESLLARYRDEQLNKRIKALEDRHEL